MKCTFSYSNPADGLSGSADDDTEEIPSAAARRFTAHLPSTTGELTSVSTSYGTVTNGMQPVTTATPNNYWSILQLKDHLGQPMSGVTVQERFSNLATEVKGHYDPATGQYDHPSSLPSDETVNDANNYWVTFLGSSGQGSVEGVFGGLNGSQYELKLDNLSLALPYASDPSGPSSWPSNSHPYPWVVLTQYYFAGTRNPTLGAYGVDVGHWTSVSGRT